VNPIVLDNVALDLGRDQQRMTTADGERQLQSVNRLLASFFGTDKDKCEVQLLADEVGLGKTYVALAVGYAILAAIRQAKPPPQVSGIGDSYRAIVVVTPQGNHALAQKWTDEVGAMVSRCSPDPKALSWFTSTRCYTPEDLLIALRKASDRRRKPGTVPTVLICEAGMFTKRIRESGAKLRFLSAALFQWLGNAVSHEVRRHVIRRAAQVRGYEDWADGVRRHERVELWDFDEHRRYLSLNAEDPDRYEFDDRRAFETVPFTYDEICDALTRFVKSPDGEAFLYSDEASDESEEPAGVVPYCKWIATKYGKAEEYFEGFKERVSLLYKELFPYLMGRSLPLVIADEAHHWRRATRGRESFCKYIAPFTQRLLLLTATPFQLDRTEISGIFSVGDSLEPTIGKTRVEALRARLQSVLSAMERSENAGNGFSQLWGHLADDLRSIGATERLSVQSIAEERIQFEQQIADYWQQLSKAGEDKLQSHLNTIPGRLRPFFDAALGLKAANERLGTAMRQLVVRHRRAVSHRRYRVGHEYPCEKEDCQRPDQHQLHAARGSALPPDTELAQFLLMKVVAAATRGKRKTALGMDVTGAYSTLWNSSEGKKALIAASQNESTKYFPTLARLTGGKSEPNKMDAVHPKVRVAVETAIQRWERDEKTLIFCFRIPTAAVLHRLISNEIENRISAARRALVHGRAAGEEAMAQFKKSLTARNGSVLPAFMDRVLLDWAHRNSWPKLELGGQDLQLIANLAARARLNGNPAIRDLKKPDRVLIARICEHVLANIYLNTLGDIDTRSRLLLSQISAETWITHRYGTVGRHVADEEDSTQGADILTRSGLSTVYELCDEPDPTVLGALSRTFSGTYQRKASVIESVNAGPNFFLPLSPFDLKNDKAKERAQHLANCLWAITLSEHGFAWEERGRVVDAVNRALLRDHFLLRLPKSVFTGEEESWSEALIRGFHSAELFQQRGEPIAAKIADFLEDLTQMTLEERAHSLRYALNPQGKAVVLVSGATKERDSVFRGFNSPLLPEILVCTQVGQEGIDLHRHCRHVVHYDLGWNPALIEQRTGRVDRLGSQTQRERKIVQQENPNVSEKDLPGLEIGLPYLAATYDERMFDRLYSRAQAFELLTGGDPSAEANEQFGREFGNADRVAGHSQFVALPQEMRKALRVNLSATADRNR
jgi:hypothetical protein